MWCRPAMDISRPAIGLRRVPNSLWLMPSFAGHEYHRRRHHHWQDAGVWPGARRFDPNKYRRTERLCVAFSTASTSLASNNGRGLFQIASIVDFNLAARLDFVRGGAQVAVIAFQRCGIRDCGYPW